jgi:hypothetical protein
MEMTNSKIRMVAVVVLVAVLIGSMVGLPAIAGTAAAQQNSSTTDSADGSTVDEVCEDPELPSMDAARLYAPTKTIDTNQAGRIEGGFDLDNNADCPVIVEVRLIVQSGMSISGGSDWGTTAAGMASTEFTITPDGSDAEDIAANVYSRTAGEARVDAEIEYWPAGHPEMSQNLDSQRFYFQVEEPNTGQGGDNESILSTIGEYLSNLDTTMLLFILAALGIIGMMFVAPKVGIDIRKK